MRGGDRACTWGGHCWGGLRGWGGIRGKSWADVLNCEGRWRCKKRVKGLLSKVDSLRFLGNLCMYDTVCLILTMD